MKYFQLKYADGTTEYAKAKDSLALIRERDLCTRKHIDTRIVELSGEMRALAIEWLEAVTA